MVFGKYIRSFPLGKIAPLGCSLNNFAANLWTLFGKSISGARSLVRVHLTFSLLWKFSSLQAKWESKVTAKWLVFLAVTWQSLSSIAKWQSKLKWPSSDCQVTEQNFTNYSRARSELNFPCEVKVRWTLTNERAPAQPLDPFFEIGGWDWKWAGETNNSHSSAPACLSLCPPPIPSRIPKYVKWAQKYSSRFREFDITPCRQIHQI